MVDIPTSITQYTDCSISTVHHTLQASRRRVIVGLIANRAVLSASIESGQTTTRAGTQSSDVNISVRQLSREIVAIEDNVAYENATGEAYHNVYTSLIQTHLPKLNAVGAIEYDSDRKIVSPDQNLLALSIVAAISSPVARLLFHDAVAKLYANGTFSSQDEITD